MVKQIILCFVVAIAATIAGFYLCQSEAFRVHYCTLLFVTVFAACIMSCCIWSDFQETLEGLSEDSKREIIGDSIIFTIISWMLPLGMLAIVIIK